MIWNYIIVVILLGLSGLFSGLNLGLMGLNTFRLRRKAKLGNKYAKELYPLRKKGNLLLCTILLGNVAVNSALAVFLTSVTTGIIAGIVSTGLIVLFGEIVPQAFFSRFPLKLSAKTIWVVYIFMIILYPVTKPLSMILDKILGKELPSHVSKREISLMLTDHKDAHDLDDDEIQIVKGCLIFSNKYVKTVMTRQRDTFFLEARNLLTPQLIAKIDNAGHSRIPVYDKKIKKVIGILYAKDLVELDPGERISIKNIMRKGVVSVNESDKLGKVLKLFKKKRTHLFIVKDDKRTVKGIITLEDVLEEIVGEIEDEFDDE